MIRWSDVWLGAVAAAGWLLGAMPPAAPSAHAGEVLPGVEVLVRDYAAALAGRRVAILTNPTGVDRALRSTIDLVRTLPGVSVVRLFAPEHGVRGLEAAGEPVPGGRDAVSGLPVVSLYGETRRPPPGSLDGIDVVLYDIQDVGHRTYTFISTLTYMMEACEQAGVELWVLDRPDPLGGDKVGGPMLDPARASFIGVHPVPQVYGLTPGEWAQLIRRERTPRLRLRVIPMQGWRRGMTYGELGWPWVPPSPHIPRWESAFFYAMTGTLGELGAVNEGVGTPQPFELVGAPWIDGRALAAALEREGLPGVRFRPTAYTPRYGGLSGQVCRGVQIHLIDPHACRPADVSGALLRTLGRLYPDRRLFAPRTGSAYEMFCKALGSDAWVQALAGAREWAAVEQDDRAALARYAARRAAVLLYD